MKPLVPEFRLRQPGEPTISESMTALNRFSEMHGDRWAWNASDLVWIEGHENEFCVGVYDEVSTEEREHV